ncbi:MAG TPA: hypothetical protein VMV18_13350, partial [bacterium]|nr:hypothetical protein [bacterium]
NYQATADGGTGGSHGAQAYYYPYDSSGNFTNSHYAVASYVTNATYDFDAAGGMVPAFSATGAFKTPSTFTLSTPNVSASTPTVSRHAAFSVAWTGGTPASFEIQLIGLDNTGAQTGFLYCEVADNGSFQIPTTSMANWSTATTEFYVITTRRIDTDFIVPSNGSTASAIATYNVVAAVIAGN